MEKELQSVEESPKANMHIDSLRATLKKYQTGKLQDLVAYMDSG